jgi:general secretion pathway protein K
MNSVRNERGVALLIALLMVAILTVTVIEFTNTIEVDGHLTRNALNYMQAGYLARSGIALGELTLLLDAIEKTRQPPLRPPAETPDDPWAVPFPPFPVGENFGAAGVIIIDESSRFNLNALEKRTSGPDAIMRQELFQGILETANLDPNLLYPVLDWLDPGDETDRESGAEAKHYLGLRPPYVPRNGRFRSLAELLMVKGFEETSYEQWGLLQAMITVLPNDELKINLNTAPEPLVRALFTALESESLSDTILSHREEGFFLNRGELTELLSAYQVPSIAVSSFDIRSKIFTIYGVGSSGGLERHITVTEELRREAFPPQLRVLRRGKNLPPVTLTSGQALAAIAPARP